VLYTFFVASCIVWVLTECCAVQIVSLLLRAGYPKKVIDSVRSPDSGYRMQQCTRADMWVLWGPLCTGEREARGWRFGRRRQGVSAGMRVCLCVRACRCVCEEGEACVCRCYGPCRSLHTSQTLVPPEPREDWSKCLALLEEQRGFLSSSFRYYVTHGGGSGEEMGRTQFANFANACRITVRPPAPCRRISGRSMPRQVPSPSSRDAACVWCRASRSRRMQPRASRWLTRQRRMRLCSCRPTSLSRCGILERQSTVCVSVCV
jgi:hypothetical protein